MLKAASFVQVVCASLFAYYAVDDVYKHHNPAYSLGWLVFAVLSFVWTAIEHSHELAQERQREFGRRQKESQTDARRPFMGVEA